MLHRPLFVYGTLRDPDLLAAVLGRALEPRHRAEAIAPGFRVVFYPGRVYPALVRAPGASAGGNLLFSLTLFELDLLDAFEGDEYRRTTLPVITDAELHEVDAYLPTAAVALDAPDWRLAAWQDAHKPAALAADALTAAELRARLIAIRPN